MNNMLDRAYKALNDQDLEAAEEWIDLYRRHVWADTALEELGIEEGADAEPGEAAWELVTNATELAAVASQAVLREHLFAAHNAMLMRGMKPPKR